jgi:hypothetical protein
MCMHRQAPNGRRLPSWRQSREPSLGDRRPGDRTRRLGDRIHRRFTCGRDESFESEAIAGSLRCSRVLCRGSASQVRGAQRDRLGDNAIGARGECAPAIVVTRSQSGARRSAHGCKRREAAVVMRLPRWRRTGSPSVCFLLVLIAGCDPAFREYSEAPAAAGGGRHWMSCATGRTACCHETGAVTPLVTPPVLYDLTDCREPLPNRQLLPDRVVGRPDLAVDKRCGRHFRGGWSAECADRRGTLITGVSIG